MFEKKPYTLFISDLHLHPGVPEITDAFQFVLDQIACQADALYILGDLFELWIGDDDDDPFVQHIANMLVQFTQRYAVPVYMMAGNRDVLLGEKFAQRCGATWLPDPYKIDLYSQRVLLTHGDQLCTFDRLHQYYRRLTHCKFIRGGFLALPLRYRRRIAHYLRRKSSAHNRACPPYITDVTPAAAAQYMQRQQVGLMIHGHTHRPAIHAMRLTSGQRGKRIVLGSWHRHINMLYFFNDGCCELINQMRP